MAMGKKVLIIEDDVDIVDIITYILNEAGYEVIFNGNSSILSELETIQPDLILLDNRLPEGLGLDICKSYKQKCKEEGKVACPVIIISADHNLAMRAKDHDADGFIEKPFEIDNLVATIAKYIPIK